MGKLIIDGHLASISQKEFADFHGSSVFTTLRSKNKAPLMWERHWQRLRAHAQFFNFVIPPEEKIYRLIDEELRDGPDQRIRIIIKEGKYALTFEPYTPPPDAIYRGVKVIVSQIQIHPQLAHLKTGNSLPYVLARKEADACLAFEALLKNHKDYVVDGTRTSILMFDGKTLTALEGGLMGCLREAVMEYAQTLGVLCARRLVKEPELNQQILLANSLIGLVPVEQIDHDVVKHLIDRFRMD